MSDMLTILPDAPTREQIDRLESVLLSIEADVGVEIETRHHFAPGVYCREVLIPAGVVLTGAEHKSEHMVTFDGDITVWHEGAMVRLTGHHTLVSTPGARRVGFAHADTWCRGFFPNPDNCTEVRELERRFVVGSERLQGNRQPVLRFVVGDQIPSELPCSA
jgi:hypothetical protein